MIKPAVGPSQIQKYNNMMMQARESEQKKQWGYASKLWRECEGLALVNNWFAKAVWSGQRATFCENAMNRGW